MSKLLLLLFRVVLLSPSPITRGTVTTVPCLGKAYVQVMEDPFTEDDSEAEQDGTATASGPDARSNSTTLAQAPEGEGNSNMPLSAADESYQIQMSPRDPLPETENPTESNQDGFLFNDAAPTQSGRLWRMWDMADVHACICGTVVTEEEIHEHSSVVKCTHHGCETRWFHLHCIDLMYAPKNWCCDNHKPSKHARR